MDSNYWFRHGETPFGRARWAPRTAPPARRGTDPERDEKFESRLLQRRVSSAKTRRTRRFRHSAAELGYQVTLVRDATAAHMAEQAGLPIPSLRLFSLPYERGKI